MKDPAGRPAAESVEAEETEERSAESVEGEEAEERSPLAAVAGSLADGAGAIYGGAGAVLSGARRIIGGRGGARVRAVRRMGHDPLPNLWDLHPEGRRASIRELGVRSVPVESIAGTAVEGPGQRGGDFLPLRDRRSDDWRSRWQRILQAMDELKTLPPVELIKFGDEFWVVDGHNRVAAALYTGQDEIDAVVQELRLPGMPSEPPVLIAPMLEESLTLREAGAGRHTRTIDRPVDRLPMQIREDNHDQKGGE